MSVPALAVQVQGQGTVSADNLNTYEQTCDNADGLRNFIGSTGVQVYMRGYSDPGDGGQGPFYWNAAGTGPDDNGVTNIVPNGAAVGCWTRLGAAPSSSNGIIQCTASGTNTISLTPIGTSISSYSNYQQFGFVAAADSTDFVTINVASIGARNAYKADGSTRLGDGDIIEGAFYEFIFNSALNSSAGGLQIVTPSGNTVYSPVVNILAVQTFVASGTYTPTAGMLYAIVEAVGGGGGSGGTAATGAATCASSAGGSSGAYAKALLTAAQIGVSQVVTIGAAGAAGTAGNNAGSAGGVTSLGSLISCPGGLGGTGSAAVGTISVTAASTGGGAAPTISSGTTLISMAGGGSGSGLVLSTTSAIAGRGGSNPIGQGGRDSPAGGGAQLGTGNGSGGGGGATNNTSATAGAAGQVGKIIITEYGYSA